MAAGHLAARTWSSATTAGRRSRPCAGSTWRSSAANASACSAPTAPARRPPSKSSKACWRRPPATSKCWACDWGQADNEIRQRIGISLQETRLSEKLTVLETLTLFRSFYREGIEPADVLARVSLEEKADALVGKLSGGQKQRLAVACALVGDPELLFLDEPTTGLDPQSRRQLWDIIREIRAAGRTVLLTTHYMDEAERLCDRVAIVDHGRVIALGIAARADRQPGRRTRHRVHARRRRPTAGTRSRVAGRSAGRQRSPRARTATSACRSPSRTSCCRPCLRRLGPVAAAS